MGNAALDNLNNGYWRIYSGTRPTDADTGLAGNTLLAEGRFGATAFPSMSGGSAVANTMTGDASANASGIPTFARLLESDGTTVFSDVGVGKAGSGQEWIINTEDGSGNAFITVSAPVDGTLTVNFGVGT